MKKVVVAEASPTIKSVADSLLRQNGYDVVCTSDGQQAWQVVSGEKPDLVLVGQGLSGISGLELCRQITSDSIAGGIPVVIMVGERDGVSEEQFISSGARGKLRKPFSPRDLLDVVERLTGQAPSLLKETRKMNELSAQSAKFSTQVSTERISQDKESYNLDWLDLNDNEITKVMPRVSSYDLSSDDSGLVISDDQYGLSNPQLEPDLEPVTSSPAKPEDDEDYEWFLGEIKKEMEGKSKFNQAPAPIAPPPAAPSRTPSKQQTESIKYDDIASSKGPARPLQTPGRSENNVFKPSAAPPVLQKKEEVGSGTPRMTEDQVFQMADRIAAKLASQIVARIDKNMIAEVIKSLLGK